MQKIMQAKYILQRHRALFAFGRPPSRLLSIYKFFLVKMIFSGFHFQGFDQNLNKCKGICCSLEFVQGQTSASASASSVDSISNFFCLFVSLFVAAENLSKGKPVHQHHLWIPFQSFSAGARFFLVKIPSDSNCNCPV